MNNRLKENYRCGTVSVAVFEDERVNSNGGEVFKTYNIKLSKSYKDKEGITKYDGSLSPWDALIASDLLKKAYDDIVRISVTHS